MLTDRLISQGAWRQMFEYCKEPALLPSDSKLLRMPTISTSERFIKNY